MAETKHTPGPWGPSGQMKDRNGAVCIEVGAETPAGHLSIAWVILGDTPTPLELREGDADARLIATAPELLEALGRAVDRIENLLGALRLPLPDRIHLEGLRGGLPDIRDEMAAAIAKAEGRAP